jgi:hypothetical protein
MYQQSKAEKPFHRSLNAMTKRSKAFKDKFLLEEPISKLLTEFMQFSDEYIELLSQVPPTISRNCFVVNNGIEKLLQEWNMLSRASEQRLIGDMKENLDKASDMAQAYCDKWNKVSRAEPADQLKTPVVYFEKLFRISRSIYAPQIPVISIPLTDYDRSENWQSLAHEFSHHIYWNGFKSDEVSEVQRKLRESISTKLFSPNVGIAKYLRQQVDRIELWENWLEEVFADVYGTLLAGVPYAISAQDRMSEQVDRWEDFLIADHEHPCVYLRPLISLYTLDFVAADLGGDKEGLEILKKRWSEFSKDAGKLKYKNVSLTDLAEDVRRVVEIIACGDYWPISFNPIEHLASPVEIRVKVSDLEAVPDQNPLEEIYPELDWDKFPTRFKAIKKQVLTTSTQLVQTLGLKRPDEDAKLMAWLSLTGLELSASSNYHVHNCTDTHRHFQGILFASHYHPPDGTDVFSC